MTRERSIYSCIPLILITLVLFLPEKGAAQRAKNGKKNKIDTIYAKTGQYVIMADTDFLAINDTFFVVQGRHKIKVKENPYAKSQAFYDSLKSKSYQNKVSKELYGLLFRNKSTTVSDSANMIKSAKVFRPFEGDHIGKIVLVKVDILEGSVYDTTLVAETGLGKFLNRYHATTKDRIIIENLLFDVGEKVDPFVLADNERVLRVLPFIDDALIEIIPDIHNDEMVTVYVITQDLMALGVDGSVSSFSDWRIALFNRNFTGRGSELYAQYQRRGDESPPDGYLIRYRDPNIRGSFIKAEVKYQNDFRENSLIVSFDREFVTPEIKYAGGLSFGNQQGFVDGRTANDTLNKREAQIEFERGFYDFWIGRSFQLNKKNERQNFVVSGRVIQENYTERPPTDETMNLRFQDRIAFFGNLSYTQRNFFKSNYIFNFGRTEDVPVGYIFSIDYGYEFGEFVERPYLAAEVGAGDYFKKFGYFAGRVGYGGYISNGKLNQRTLRFGGLYFTPLLKLGRSRVRQYLTINYVNGFERDSIDLINLRGFTRGTNGSRYRGNERLAFNYESNFFTPVYIYGFKLVAFPLMDWGWLAYNENLFAKNNFYYGFGGGVRFRNESFILRTIGISLTYYPQLIERSVGLSINFTASDPRLFRRFGAIKPGLLEYR